MPNALLPLRCSSLTVRLDSNHAPIFYAFKLVLLQVRDNLRSEIGLKSIEEHDKSKDYRGDLTSRSRLGSRQHSAGMSPANMPAGSHASKFVNNSHTSTFVNKASPRSVEASPALILAPPSASRPSPPPCVPAAARHTATESWEGERVTVSEALGPSTEALMILDAIRHVQILKSQLPLKHAM